MFLCRKPKFEESQKNGNTRTEKLQGRDNGITNNGMEADDGVDIEAKEENNEQVSDPERCSQGSKASLQVKGSIEHISIPERCSEGSNPGRVGGVGNSDSNVHKLLYTRYVALGPLSFKEQQVAFMSNIPKVLLDDKSKLLGKGCINSCFQKPRTVKKGICWDPQKMNNGSIGEKFTQT